MVNALPPQVMQFTLGTVDSSGVTRVGRASAFEFTVGGRTYVAAPYHAWAAVGLEPDPDQKSLLNRIEVAIPDGSAPADWQEYEANILAADSSHDLVLLSAPPASFGVRPLDLAATEPFVGSAVYGYGFGEASSLGGSTGNALVCWQGVSTVPGLLVVDEATDSANENEAPWKNNLSAFILSANQDFPALPGDSGSPGLDPEGDVVGMEVASGPTEEVLVPVADLAQLAQSLAPKVSWVVTKGKQSWGRITDWWPHGKATYF